MSVDTAHPLSPAARIARRRASLAVSTAPIDRAEAERALQALAIIGEVELPTRRIWVDSPDAAATLALREGLGEPWNAEMFEAREAADILISPDDRERIWTDVRFSGVTLPTFWFGRARDAALTPTFVGVSAFEAAQLELADETLGRRSAVARAQLLAAEALHWVWVFDDAVVLCERPTEVHLDDRGRLHAESGAALSYADGPDAFAWHGAVVPAWVILSPASPRLLGDDTARAKASAIEHAGWPEVIRVLGLPTIAECPDPGNGANILRLHRLPDALAVQLYGRRAYLLTMTNGSPHADGSFAAFGEVVPADLLTPLDAVAWQYGVEPDVYAQLARRT